MNYQRYRLYQLPFVLILAVFIYFLPAYANNIIQTRQSEGKPYQVKEFNVNAPVRLDVQTSGGNIRVESRSENKVRVEMYVRKNGHYLTPHDNALKNYKIDISKHGNEIRAIVRQRHGFGTIFGRQPSISFVLYTPKSVNGKLNTSGGNITIRNLKGELENHTSGGNIEAVNISGDFTLGTSGGQIIIHKAQGKIMASTSGGNVQADNSDGSLNLRTSGGSISLNNVGGDITAKTSGGNISASIHKVTNQLSLKTSGGNITATIPGNQGYTLDLRGSSVNTNLQKFNGTLRHNRVRGNVEGGGPKITLKTSGGNITLSN